MNVIKEHYHRRKCHHIDRHANRTCCNLAQDFRDRWLTVNEYLFEKIISPREPISRKPTDHIKKLHVMSDNSSKLIDDQSNVEGNIYKFPVTTWPAGGLAPPVAKPSAGKLIMKYTMYICMCMTISDNRAHRHRLLRNVHTKIYFSQYGFSNLVSEAVLENPC